VTSLLFEILGNSVGAVHALRETGDASQDTGERLKELGDKGAVLEARIAQLQARLLELSAIKASPKIDLEIDAAEARLAQIDVKLAELGSKTSSPRVDAEITAWEAKRALVEQQLRELNDKKASPKVDADIAVVTANLERLRSELDRNHSALRTLGDDSDDAGRHTKKLGDEQKSLAEAMNLAAIFGKGSWRDMVVAMAPAILPAVAAIGALSGALGAIPAAAGFGATALAALVVGMHGMIDTIGLYTKAQDAMGTNAAQTAAQQLSSADSIISAQSRVKDAVASVADAQRTSANSIISAEEAVSSAVQSAADAQRQAANSISAAQENLTSAVSAAAAARRDAAESGIQAEERLASAVQAESDAEQTAAQNNAAAVQTQQRAEESLQSAQESALRAQQNLTDARQAAQRSIQDLANQAIDGALAERKAVDQLQAAKENLDKTRSAKYTQEQRDDAQLTYDMAVQHLAETQLASKRAQADSKEAAAAGVEGSQQVMSAQDQVLSSQRALINAQTALDDATAKVTQTQLKGAEQVAKAQQAVGDAQRAMALEQIKSAESIAKADEKVVDTQSALVEAYIVGAERIAAADQKVGDSQRALVEAQISGAEKIAKAQDAVEAAQRALTLAIAQSAATAAGAAGSMAEFDVALAKLAPSAQDFVRALISVAPAWQALQLDVQQTLFAGLGDQMKQLAGSVIPVLRDGLVGMAGALNAMVVQFVQWVTSAQTIKDFGTMFNNFTLAGHNLAGAIKPILDIIRDISVVGSEFLPSLASGFANAAASAAAFIAHARETGQLHTWIQSGITAMHTLFQIVGDLIVIVKDLMSGPGGFGFLNMLHAITSSVRWLLDNFPILIPIVEGLFIAFKAAQIIAGIYGVLTAIGLIAPASAVAATAAGGLAAAEGAAGTAGVVASGGIAAGFFAAALPILAVIAVIAAVAAAAYLIYTNWAPISGFFVSLWGNISAGFSSLRDDFMQGWRDMVDLFFWAVNAIGSGGRGMWDGMLTGLKYALNAIISEFNDAIQGINTLIGGVNYVSSAVGIPAIPYIPYIPHFAAGGVSAGGLAWVGELGPELVNLPAGASVIPNNQLGGSGSGPPQKVVLVINSGGSQMDNFLIEMIRRSVRVQGGDVQLVLGT
jgi:hypothetical protein